MYNRRRSIQVSFPNANSNLSAAVITAAPPISDAVDYDGFFFFPAAGRPDPAACGATFDASSTFPSPRWYFLSAHFINTAFGGMINQVLMVRCLNCEEASMCKIHVKSNMIEIFEAQSPSKPGPTTTFPNVTSSPKLRPSSLRQT